MEGTSVVKMAEVKPVEAKLIYLSKVQITKSFRVMNLKALEISFLVSMVRNCWNTFCNWITTLISSLMISRR